MQMAAKIVYYGPGLCGKTTNLSFIYAKTSPNSRGEMVSLETESDRTLFFDLLPIEVGTIGGFKTRLQLYTVPGQVFYNTTRKLVLKGVDGVVFVADSQRPMREANIESFANLRENLAELGLEIDEVPLVLQFNKRDLQNTLTLEELNQDLNPDGIFPFQESAAVNGDGVFETLKKITKLTLKKLRRRMASPESTARPAAAPVRPAPTAPDSRPAAISAAALARAAEEGVESGRSTEATGHPPAETPVAFADPPQSEAMPEPPTEVPAEFEEPSSAPFAEGDAAHEEPTPAPDAPFPDDGEPTEESAEAIPADEALPTDAGDDPSAEEIEPDTEPEFDEPHEPEEIEEPAPGEDHPEESGDVAAEDHAMVAEALPEESAAVAEESGGGELEPQTDDDEITDPEVEFDHPQDEPDEPTPPLVKRVQVSNQMDILAELDSLRKQATMGGQDYGAVASTPDLDLDSLLAAPRDRKKELKRTIKKTVNSDIFQHMHGLQLAIRIQDREGETIHILDPVTLPVSDSGSLDSLSLRLVVDLENHK